MVQPTIRTGLRPRRIPIGSLDGEIKNVCLDRRVSKKQSRKHEIV